jgi:hypothetical protein
MFQPMKIASVQMPATQAITLNFVGHEQVPVIILDNFMPAPQQLVDDAAMLAFQPIGPYYPGVRAPVPMLLIQHFMSGALEALIASTFGLAGPCDVLESYYSLVTTPPQRLAPIQRLPHFDSVEPERLALLQYLSPIAQGGTAFFRHRTTGYERITALRMADYSKALEADIKIHGLPPARYIAGDTPLFKQIGHIEARFNRAILYPGNLLHCADIPADMQLSANPSIGRLTVNTFLLGKSRE